MTRELFPVNAPPPPPAGGPSPVPLLALLAQLGCARGMVPALAEFGGFTLSADDRRFLDGPLVVHSAGGWAEDLPRWMPAQARAERVEIVLGDAPWIVGPTELAAAMYAATCEAPLSHDYAELYLWGSVHAMARHTGQGTGELWAMLDHRPITDRDVCARGGRLWHVYQPLADTIRRRVIANAKACGPALERRLTPTPAPTPAPAAHGQPPAPIPTDLFAGLST